MSIRLLNPALLTALLTAAPALAFDLQAHRGGRGLMPENTLPAFANALGIGVTTLELDTGITRDGVVVVTHNPTLEPDITRDAAGRWLTKAPPIASLTLSEVQSHDVGRINPASRLSSRFPSQTPVDGARIPTLEQVFALALSAPHVRFNIETKIDPRKPDLTTDPESFAKALITLISRHDLADRVSIQSFDWRTLQAVQRLAPNIETVYLSARQRWLDNIALVGGQPLWTAGFNIADHGGDVARMVKAAGGAVWSPFHGDLRQGDVKAAQSLGLRVIPWTVNDPAAMRALIKAGVDGLITDYPDLLRAEMAQAGLPLPPPTPVQP